MGSWATTSPSARCRTIVANAPSSSSAPNLYGLDGYVQVPAGALDYLLGSHGTRRYRIPQEGHARNPWDGLLQKLQILADDVGGGIVGQSGDVSPRPCKARDEFRAHRISRDCHDDGDCRRRLFHRAMTGLDPVTMMSTLSRTSSAARAGSRSAVPRQTAVQIRDFALPRSRVRGVPGPAP